MVIYQKWFEDEIARWKVRRPRYDLSKQLMKIHMQQRGVHRDVTRRAAAGKIFPYYDSEQVP